ncbi:GNAT family N-acetyltransferase [Legionella sp. CNM-1927-20]|uniref:GNAT family N-acetyltransferase n=1 Tax=Legionella sp. CNM-1927-20 TaxID=3422221 RepID=UPI00403AC6B4
MSKIRFIKSEQSPIALIDKFQNSLQGFFNIAYSSDISAILTDIHALEHFSIERIKEHEYDPSTCTIISDDTPFLEEILANNGKFQSHDNTYFYYVLKFNDKIIGHLQFTHFNNEDDNYLHLAGIEIAEEYQGNKLGNLLLSKLIEYALQNNLKEIQLLAAIHPNQKNSREGMFKFYCNFGFKPVDDQIFLEETDYEDIPWYQRTLGQKLSILLGNENDDTSTHNLNIEMDLDLNNNSASTLVKNMITTVYKQCLFEQKILELISQHAKLFSQYSPYDFTKEDLLSNPIYQQYLSSAINHHPESKALEEAWQGIGRKQKDYLPNYNPNDIQLQPHKQQFLTFVMNLQSVNVFKNPSP